MGSDFRSGLKRWTGIWPRLASGATPVRYLHDLGVLDARPLLVHAVHVCDEDIGLIAATGCSVVHCPRSNTALSCGRMPVERFIEAGVRLYLGTDSCASSPDLDVRKEADFARKLHGDRVPPGQVEAMLQRPLP